MSQVYSYLKERDHFGDLREDGRIILKSILRNMIGSIWLGIGPVTDS
jgi:hypothetical protein